MKRKLLAILALTILCMQGYAETALLPYYQWSHKPWDAKFYHAPNSGEKPAENWYAVDFDDSSWGNIQGQVSTSVSYQTIVTPWDGNNTTYWFRRHFNAKAFNPEHVYTLYLRYDDECEVYLNGKQLYKSSQVSTHTEVDVTAMLDSILVAGDNVMAVRVSDTGAGEAYADFGFYEYTVKQPRNANFINGTSSWSYNNYSSYYYDFSNYLFSLGKGYYLWKQDLADMPDGLYKLKVQAFERKGDINTTWYNRDTVATTIFLNECNVSIKNIFDDATSDNIYSSNAYFTTPEQTYVPNDGYSYVRAMNAGLYDNTLYAYVEGGSLQLGITAPQVSGSRTIIFDNFRLDYINQTDLTDEISYIEQLSKGNLDANLKTRLAEAVGQIKSAADYESKSHIFESNSRLINDAVLSAGVYDNLKEAISSLQQKLGSTTGASPITRSEADAALKMAQSLYGSGSSDNSAVRSLISKLIAYENHLDYPYMDINVTTPGSLGDSILAHTDNFVDVVSLKVSGTINAADWSTIKSRLTSLRELDITDLNTTSIAAEQFRGKSSLQRIDLPKTLTSIGDRAFYGCSSLTTINLPAGLSSIGSYAFYQSGVQSIVLPEGLSGIGEYCFQECRQLTTVQLPSTLTVISNYAFYNCPNLVNVEFAEGLTNIGSHSFYNCNLRELSLPKSLKVIGNDAFQDNRNYLTEVVFPEGLTHIGDNAFYNCDALQSVTLPSTLISLYSSPFDYCDNLQTVTCYAAEPPYLTASFLYGISMNGRTLRVPEMSLNNYKQTNYWDDFPAIEPIIGYMPETITVIGNYKLTLTDNMPEGYHPNVILEHEMRDNYYQYGRLTINGNQQLSIKKFSMVYDPNWQIVYNSRLSNYCALLNNSNVSADSISVDIWVRNYRWMFITLPYDVKVSEIKDLSGTANWIIRSYSGSRRAAGESRTTWEKMTADSTLRAGQGYILQASRYVGNSSQEYSGLIFPAVDNQNKNRIFESDDVTMKLGYYESDLAQNRGWNLVGNPYPCYFDSRYIHYSAPITVWDMYNRTYQAYSPLDDSYILLPGEAFFLQCPVTKNELTFSSEGRQIDRTVREFTSPARVAASDASRTVINLSLTDGETTDRTRVVVNEQALLSYEADKDASKFAALQDGVPQMCTTAGTVDYAINERPLGDGVVELSLTFGRAGRHVISLDNEQTEYTVELIDRQTGVTTDLTLNGEFAFDAEKGDSKGRFALNITRPNTAVDSIESDTEGDDAIYTITGVKVSEPLAPGFYIKNGKKIHVR